MTESRAKRRRRMNAARARMMSGFNRNPVGSGMPVIVEEGLYGGASRTTHPSTYIGYRTTTSFAPFVDVAGEFEAMHAGRAASALAAYANSMATEAEAVLATAEAEVVPVSS